MCTTISPIPPTVGQRGRNIGPGPADRRPARIHPGATPSARAMYRRRRLTLAVILAVLVAPLWMVVGPAAASPPAPGNPAPVVVDSAPVTVHVVAPGDTLWSIARRNSPEGDVRRAVDELARINGGTDLRVGDHLVIPW